MFSKVIKCLEQNIQKKLIAKDHRIPNNQTNEQSTKYSN